MVRKTLLAIGETMAMVTPETAVRVTQAERFRVDAGGAESNVAAHVAALGHRAEWFSRLGADALGDRVLAQLSRADVDTSRVIRDGAHRTGLYVEGSRARGVVLPRGLGRFAPVARRRRRAVARGRRHHPRLGHHGRDLGVGRGRSSTASSTAPTMQACP